MSVAARLGGSPVCFVQESFPTEPVTREAHPYPLSGEGEQEISHPSSSSEPHRIRGSAPPAVLVNGIPCEASARSREAES
ncbi:hypothetical protein Taro_026715, partial [Colocasia esculenta]|nr:hypothetical protein [Colocasia esculenta]